MQNPRQGHKIASTHAQMHQRNVIHARVLFLYSRSRPAPLGAGRGREYEKLKLMIELVCMSREAPRFLALESVTFRQQQLTRPFSLSEGRSDLPLYTKISAVLSTATEMA